jgi:phage recombination protein Bet
MSTKTKEIVDFNAEQIALIKSQIAPKATDDELKLFINQCKRTGLDPFARQIYCIHRKESGGKEKMSIQTSIDGFRLIAERTGQYGGQGEPRFEYDANGFPVKCTIAVYKFKGSTRYEAAIGVAYYSEYVQTKAEYQNNQPTGRKIPTEMWGTKPHIMLGKVTEALALRKAFPQELSGLYTEDEMGQATNTDTATAETGVMQKPAQLPASTAVPFNPQYTAKPEPVAATHAQGNNAQAQATTQAQPPKYSAFQQTYKDADGIRAVLAMANNKKDILTLYTSNKAIVDMNKGLQDEFSKRKTQVENGGKLIITDEQFNKVCERIKNGELAVYDNANNVYLLNDKQSLYLKEIYQHVANVEAAVVKNHTDPALLIEIVNACTCESQINKLHKNNAMLMDRDQEVAQIVQQKILSFSKAA